MPQIDPAESKLTILTVWIGTKRTSVSLDPIYYLSLLETFNGDKVELNAWLSNHCNEIARLLEASRPSDNNPAPEQKACEICAKAGMSRLLQREIFRFLVSPNPGDLEYLKNKGFEHPHLRSYRLSQASSAGESECA